MPNAPEATCVAPGAIAPPQGVTMKTRLNTPARRWKLFRHPQPRQGRLTVYCEAVKKLKLDKICCRKFLIRSRSILRFHAFAPFYHRFSGVTLRLLFLSGLNHYSLAP